MAIKTTVGTTKEGTTKAMQLMGKVCEKWVLDDQMELLYDHNIDNEVFHKIGILDYQNQSLYITTLTLKHFASNVFQN